MGVTAREQLCENSREKYVAEAPENTSLDLGEGIRSCTWNELQIEDPYSTKNEATEGNVQHLSSQWGWVVYGAKAVPEII